VIAVELYGHEQDPRETVNVAANHPQVVRRLIETMRADWLAGSTPLSDPVTSNLS
jgi:hypothetical protein